MNKLKPILLSLFLCAYLAVSAQKQLKVTADLPGFPEGEVVFIVDAVSQVTDSAIIKDHKFLLTCETDTGSLYIVQVGRTPTIEHSFYRYMEPGEIHVTGSANNFQEATFSGSPFVERWTEMLKFMDVACGGDYDYYTELANKMVQAQGLGDTEALEEIKQKLVTYTVNGQKAAKEWLKKYPDEGISSYVINLYLFNKIPLDEVQELIKGLEPNGQKTRLATLMLNAKSPISTSTTFMDQQAPEIELKDADGKLVKLSDFKGKYVLLDFWASWCGPCRTEMPFLKKAYEQFNSENFTILSLSTDTDMEKWRTALVEENMPWAQLVDDSTTSAAKAYQIQYIPANFLIDPNGKVVAYGLRGEKMIEQIEIILKNS